jgi:hypothetical protein
LNTLQYKIMAYGMSVHLNESLYDYIGAGMEKSKELMQKILSISHFCIIFVF